MFNGMAQTVAFPLGSIIGAGGQPPAMAKGTPGTSGSFDNLLGLFGMAGMPPGMSPGGGLPEVSGVMNPSMTDATSERAIDVLLPLNLAQALGLDTQALPETAMNNPATGTGEPLVAARAVIVGGPENSGNIIALKFPLPAGKDEVMADSVAAGTDKDAMILPMRLRTVEQQGGRLVADAELLTATGKDVSLRISLDLTGNTAEMNTMGSKFGETAGGKTPISVSNGQENLSTLLKNLNATTMTIEQIPGEAEVALSSLTPRDLLMRGGSVRPFPLNGSAVPTDTVMGLPQASQINTGLSVSNGIMPTAAMERLTEAMPSTSSPDTQLKGGGNATQISPNSSETAFFGTTSVTSLDSGTPTIETFEPRTSEVRYFNLDNKLAQLKHNPGQAIKVQLVPAQLGKMELSIVNYRGTVTVNMTMESNQAKQAVERNLGQLERQLSSAGIRVDNVQLHVNQPFRNSGLAYQQQQFAHYYGNSNGSYGRGYNSGRNADGNPHKGHFGAPDESFERVMVNYLA